MYWVDDDNDDHLLSNADYMEKTLREALTVTRLAIREANTARNSFLFEEYVRYLGSLNGDLTKLAEVLLALTVRADRHKLAGSRDFRVARQGISSQATKI